MVLCQAKEAVTNVSHYANLVDLSLLGSVASKLAYLVERRYRTLWSVRCLTASNLPEAQARFSRLCAALYHAQRQREILHV